MTKNKINKVDFELLSLPTLDGDSKNIKVLSGKATRELALASSKNKSNLTINEFSNTAKHIGQVTIFEILEYDKRDKDIISTRTHQVLMLLVNYFTLGNSEDNKQDLNLEVKLEIKKVAELMGYDVYNSIKKKAKSETDNARTMLNKEIDLLFNMKFTIKGQDGDYRDVRIIQSKGKERGYIVAELSNKLGLYLLGQQQNWYDLNLLAIDGNDPNTYIIGTTIVDRWNTKKYTYKGKKKIEEPLPERNRLSVKNLLSKTTLPTYSYVLEKGLSWYYHIKEPFENSLRKLIDTYKVITRYDYGRANNELLTEEEYRNIDDFETWINLNVYFERDTEH